MNTRKNDTRTVDQFRVAGVHTEFKLHIEKNQKAVIDNGASKKMQMGMIVTVVTGAGSLSPEI